MQIASSCVTVGPTLTGLGRQADVSAVWGEIMTRAAKGLTVSLQFLLLQHPYSHDSINSSVVFDKYPHLQVKLPLLYHLDAFQIIDEGPKISNISELEKTPLTCSEFSEGNIFGPAFRTRNKGIY